MTASFFKDDVRLTKSANIAPENMSGSSKDKRVFQSILNEFDLERLKLRNVLFKAKEKLFEKQNKLLKEDSTFVETFSQHIENLDVHTLEITKLISNLVEIKTNEVDKIINTPFSPEEYSKITAILNNYIEVFIMFRRMLEDNQKKPIDSPLLRERLSTLLANSNYLPGQNDQLLDFMLHDLSCLSTSCALLTIYLLQYCLISHGAIIAASTFASAAIIFAGAAACIYLWNRKSELAIIVDNLNSILMRLAEHEFEVVVEPNMSYNGGRLESEDMSVVSDVSFVMGCLPENYTYNPSSDMSSEGSDTLNGLSSSQIIRKAKDLLESDHLGLSTIEEEDPQVLSPVSSKPKNSGRLDGSAWQKVSRSDASSGSSSSQLSMFSDAFRQMGRHLMEHPYSACDDFFFEESGGSVNSKM